MVFLANISIARTPLVEVRDRKLAFARAGLVLHALSVIREPTRQNR